jgi:hypothetical protein
MSKKKIRQCLSIIERGGDCFGMKCFDCPKSMPCQIETAFDRSSGGDKENLLALALKFAKKYVDKKQGKTAEVPKNDSSIRAIYIHNGNYRIDVDCNGITIYDIRTNTWVLDASDIIASGKANYFDLDTGECKRIKVMEGAQNDKS